MPTLIHLHISSNCTRNSCTFHIPHFISLPLLLLLHQPNICSICICTCPPPPYVYSSPCVVMTSTQMGEGGRCCSGAGWDTTVRHVSLPLLVLLLPVHGCNCYICSRKLNHCGALHQSYVHMFKSHRRSQTVLYGCLGLVHLLHLKFIHSFIKSFISFSVH